MPVSKSKKRPAEPVIDFDEAMKYPPLAVPGRKKKKAGKAPGKESKMAKLNLARVRAVLNHYGPGPHKDGSSQDVHGKKGAGGGTQAPGNQPKKYGQADQKTLIKRIGHSRTRLRDLDTAGRLHSDDYKMFEKRLERDLEEYVNRFGELPDWLR